METQIYTSFFIRNFAYLVPKLVKHIDSSLRKGIGMDIVW